MNKLCALNDNICMSNTIKDTDKCRDCRIYRITTSDSDTLIYPDNYLNIFGMNYNTNLQLNKMLNDQDKITDTYI